MHSVQEVFPIVRRSLWRRITEINWDLLDAIRWHGVVHPTTFVTNRVLSELAT